ncbi:Alpha/Beta hydrolase protein [Coniochaeta sp. 2T2.1]|nr:Alpha/Beta hydrolase protein [Coniochaeta sp. 2T2.1]
MTLTATKFTPEVLLSAPRRSQAAPNPTGTKALFTVSTYSFDTHKKTSQIRVLDVKSGDSTLLYENSAYNEPVWITDTEFLFFKSAERGSTSLMLADASRPGSEPTQVRTFRGTLSNLRVIPLPEEGAFALACSAPSTPEGHMASPENERSSRSSAKVYDELFVRHWDSWIGRERNAIWYGRLERAKGDSSPDNGGKEKEKGEFTFTSSQGLVNVLAGTDLVSPIPPFGGAGDFDIGPRGLVFVARDPECRPAASYTKSDLYFVPLQSYTEDPAPKPRRVETKGLEGYSQSPKWSHDGKRLAFTRMREKQYESDKTRLMVVEDLHGGEKELVAREVHEGKDGEGRWDAKPDVVAWGVGDRSIYVTAEEKTKAKVWKVDLDKADKELPKALTSEGVVSSIEVLDNGSLFLCGSSLVDSSLYSILDPDTEKLEVVSSASKGGKTFGLSKAQVDEIWTPGAGDYDVHSIVIKPSHFDEKKKYPLALFIHGGPQGEWMDAWSTRWNPAIFAEQGYVVVCPNPTGSSGYGMALQDGIAEEWGGRPYNDLVNCFEWIADNLPYVDTGNAVALGASYGGYMINWIQGHPLGRKFKALVCHDGVFSTLHMWQTEELFFPIHDFGGTMWENRAGYEKWDPAKAELLAEWATPQLVIHSELDYRLCVTEGMAAFNVLQQKGVPSRFLVFPDENHWVLKPENSLVWHKEVLGWINKYTGLDKSDEAPEEKVRNLSLS